MEYDSGEKARGVRGPDAKLLVFEDLVRCDERSICLILREVEALDLTKALKGAGPALQKKVFATMGNRGAWLIKEDMKYLGNLPREEVEQAQNIIIAVAARLEDAGEIVIPRQD